MLSNETWWWTQMEAVLLCRSNPRLEFALDHPLLHSSLKKQSSNEAQRTIWPRHCAALTLLSNQSLRALKISMIVKEAFLPTSSPTAPSMVVQHHFEPRSCSTWLLPLMWHVKGHTDFCWFVCQPVSRQVLTIGRQLSFSHLWVVKVTTFHIQAML